MFNSLLMMKYYDKGQITRAVSHKSHGFYENAECIFWKGSTEIVKFSF